MGPTGRSQGCPVWEGTRGPSGLLPQPPTPALSPGPAPPPGRLQQGGVHARGTGRRPVANVPSAWCLVLVAKPARRAGQKRVTRKSLLTLTSQGCGGDSGPSREPGSEGLPSRVVASWLPSGAAMRPGGRPCRRVAWWQRRTSPVSSTKARVAGDEAGVLL